MKILFLSQRIPYPPNRGDKITTWRLVERMSRNHEVTCVAFAHDAADFEAAEELTKKGIRTVAVGLNARLAKFCSLPLLLTRKPLTLGFYGSSALQARVEELARDADVAYAYSSSMGAFLEAYGDLPRVMHFAELDSDKWRQYSEGAGIPLKWIYRREWKTLHDFESRIAHAFSENVFCTPIEEAIFNEQIPGASSLVLRNGVDLDYYAPDREHSEPGHLVFTGMMDYFPNIDGCRFFAAEVFPRVRERFPEARFTILGARPVPDIQRLGRQEGIHVTGFVDDTRDWLRRAAISVAPLRIARGIQNKVLEAMAMGLPVVGTRPATQGIEGEAGRDFLLADEPGQMAEDICALLTRPDEAVSLGARARSFVEENYDWEKVFAPLDGLLERLGPGQLNGNGTDS